MFKLIKDFINFRKGWSEEWLKMNERNYLASGTQFLNQPMRQSYLVHKCVMLISQNAPQAPLMFENTKTETVLSEESPLVRLFRSPNEYMTDYDLLSMSAMYYSLYGEAFWYLNESMGQVLGTSKIPSEIIVVDPRGMKEILDDNRVLVEWEFNGKVRIPKEEVIHIKNNNPYNPWRGLSPLDAIDVEIKTDFEAGKYSKYFFENGAIPGTVLITHEDDNSTPAELKKIGKQFDTRHKGSDKAYRTAVLRGGMDIKITGLSQQEMNFIDSRKFSRDLVLSVFGVPPSLAGFTNDINRATSEVQKKIFWQETIKPILTKLQRTLNIKILPKIDPNIRCYFDFTKIQELQREYKDDVEAGYQLFQMGFSRNELNKRFDYGFDEDKEYGDLKRVPMNLSRVDVEDEEIEMMRELDSNPPDDDPDDENESKSIEKQTSSQFERNYEKKYQQLHSKYEKILTTKFRSFFFKQRSKILKNLYKEEKSVDRDILNRINIINDETKRLANMLISYFMEMTTEAQRLALETLGIDRDVILNKKVVQERLNMITNSGSGILHTIFKEMLGQVQIGINNGESVDKIAERIKKVYNVTDSRALKIARTETSALVSRATMLEYAENGVKYKKWLTSRDERVREEHSANGREGAIPVMQSFQNGEKYPGEHSINCRCTLVPITRI